MSQTVIGPLTRIAGALLSQDDLLIEGVVEGAVDGEAAVIIAAGSTVRGDVRGREVVVAGRLHHNVRASAVVRLAATAELRGDIDAPRVAIEEGALFEGQVRMGRSVAAPSADERRAPDSPMRGAAPAPTVREIPSLPPLGKRKLVRRAR